MIFLRLRVNSIVLCLAFDSEDKFVDVDGALEGVTKDEDHENMN